ncbi:MAG: hypothetical protein SGILL_003299 [Bacillariaceae sp.]
MSSFPAFSRSSTGSSSGSKDHSVEIPSDMELDEAQKTSFRGSGDTASVSSKDSNSSNTDSDEGAKEVILSKHHLQGDMHYDDGPTRKSSFQAITTNHGIIDAASNGVSGHHHISTESTIDLNYNNKKSGLLVNPEFEVPLADAPVTLSGEEPVSQVAGAVAARIKQFSTAAAGNNNNLAVRASTKSATGSCNNSYLSSLSTQSPSEGVTGSNDHSTTVGAVAAAPRPAIRRIPSLLSARSTPSRCASLSSIKEGVGEDDGDSLDHQDHDFDADGAATDEEPDWEDSMSEIGSIHTENPQFIAIGIVRAPSNQIASDTGASPSQVNSITGKKEQEGISVAVAQDLAKEEHDLKLQERAANNLNASDMAARRRSAPSVLAARKMAFEMEQEERTDGDASKPGARRPSRSSFSAHGHGSTSAGPRKSFLLSLSEDELLPTVVEPVAPPVRTSSFTKTADAADREAHDEAGEDGSAKTSPSVTPRVRARKSNSGRGSTTMSDGDRAAKMRTVRGALGVEPGARRSSTTIQRPKRSQSNASTAQPVQPARSMPFAPQRSLDASIGEVLEANEDDVQKTSTGEDEVSVCPSLRTIQSMQSTRSFSSVSSGITLDEKTRERIAQSAPLRARRPARTLSDGVDTNEAPEDDKKVAATNSTPSTVDATTRPSDDKRSMRISPSSLQSMSSASPFSQNQRPSDEKAQFRRPDISSMTSRGSTHSQGVASLHSASSDDIPKSSSSNDYPEVDEEVPFPTVMPSDMSYDVVTEDLEAQAGVPVLLPGAFAVGGSHDEEDEFDDTDSLVGSGTELVEVLEENPSQVLSRGSISGSVEASTPLQAELYEENSFVNAEVLVEEEDAEEKVLRRSFLAKAICVFVVIAAIAGIVIGVVVPRSTGSSDVTDGGDDGNGVPVIQGWNGVGESLMGPTYKDNIRFGNSVALSGDGTRMAVGLPGADNQSPESLKSTGSVKIYDIFNGTSWIEINQITGLFANAESGSKVVLSEDGSRVAIGAPSYASDRSGYVAVYQESNETGAWEQVGGVIHGDLDIEEAFGDSIGFSTDGKVLAIGDKYSDRSSDGAEDTGLLRVFYEFNNTWTQKGADLYGAEPGERFGWAVALSEDGERVAVTSLGTNDSPGSAHVYDFDGDTWNKVGSSLIGESPREAFGASLALSLDGMRLAIGATSYSRQGQDAGVGVVRFYQFDEIQQDWSVFGQPLEGTNPFDAFGSSVDMSSTGDIVAIGGPENQNFCNNCGHVQVFQFQDGSWNRIGSELGQEDIDGGQFGYAVALSSDGTRLAGAAPFTTFDGFVSKVGQVIVFDVEEEKESS